MEVGTWKLVRVEYYHLSWQCSMLNLVGFFSFVDSNPYESLYNQGEAKEDEEFLTRFAYTGSPLLFELWMLPVPVSRTSLLKKEVTYKQHG